MVHSKFSLLFLKLALRQYTSFQFELLLLSFIVIYYYYYHYKTGWVENAVDVLQELTKLRAKITSTVQVLTHLKEKLQFVNGENLVEKQRLHEVEELVARVSHCTAMLYLTTFNQHH